jgi:hypothetical protein
VQLCRYFVSQSSEFCRHNPFCCFSTSVYCCCLFRYRLSPETFGYILICLVLPNDLFPSRIWTRSICIRLDSNATAQTKLYAIYTLRKVARTLRSSSWERQTMVDQPGSARKFPSKQTNIANTKYQPVWRANVYRPTEVERRVIDKCRKHLPRNVIT